MTEKTPAIVIADSSRMGTHMLEKILAPLLDLRCCHNDDDLRDSLARNPSVCLISHQWPDLEDMLDEVLTVRPDIQLVLLASPESDSRRLATLCEHYQATLLYRPYQPTQVIRELLQRLAGDAPAPQQEPLSLGATDIAGPELVLRDMAFCQRHGLPMSLLALRIEDYAALSMELGETALKSMELTLLHAISDKLRREDSVCFHRPGSMAFSLPGTPPLGARVLAHRLRNQLGNEGVSVGGFQVHATLVAGIHSPENDPSAQAQQIIDEALATAGGAISTDDDSAVQFSESARACTDQLLSDNPGEADQQPEPVSATPEPAPADPDQLWRSLEEILNSAGEDADSPRQAVLQKLVRVLARLDENARMTLVDELLMASARAD